MSEEQNNLEGSESSPILLASMSPEQIDLLKGELLRRKLDASMEWREVDPRSINALLTSQMPVLLAKDPRVWEYAPWVEEQYFLEQHGAFLNRLSDAFHIPKDRFLSLIERESSFLSDKKADKTGVSFGYGQLTQISFDDMKFTISSRHERNTTGRWANYMELLARLDESIVSAVDNPLARDTLTQLLGYIASDGTVSQKSEYNRCIQQLSLLARQDDRLNLIMTAVVYRIKESEVNEDIAEKGDGMKALCLQQLDGMKRHSDKLLWMVLQGAPWDPEINNTILRYRDQITEEIAGSEHPEVMRDFYTLVKYNASVNRLYYAMSVMIRERMRWA